MVRVVLRYPFQRPPSQPAAKTNPISDSNRSKGAQGKLLVKGGKGRKGQKNVRIRERWEAGSEDEDDEEDDKVVKKVGQSVEKDRVGMEIDSEEEEQETEEEENEISEEEDSDAVSVDDSDNGEPKVSKAGVVVEVDLVGGSKKRTKKSKTTMNNNFITNADTLFMDMHGSSVGDLSNLSCNNVANQKYLKRLDDKNERRTKNGKK